MDLRRYRAEIWLKNTSTRRKRVRLLQSELPYAQKPPDICQLAGALSQRAVFFRHVLLCRLLWCRSIRNRNQPLDRLHDHLGLSPTTERMSDSSCSKDDGERPRGLRQWASWSKIPKRSKRLSGLSISTDPATDPDYHHYNHHDHHHRGSKE